MKFHALSLIVVPSSAIRGGIESETNNNTGLKQINVRVKLMECMIIITVTIREIAFWAILLKNMPISKQYYVVNLWYCRFYKCFKISYV